MRLPKLGRGAAPHRRRLGDGHSGVLDLGGWGYIIYYMFYLIYLIYYYNLSSGTPKSSVGLFASAGASMIRTKGEAGTGDVVEAVRHMRTMHKDTPH